MRGSTGSIEPRHRSSGSINGPINRRFQRNRTNRGYEKPFNIFNWERCCSCKFPTLTITLVVILCVTVVIHSGSGASFFERWIWASPVANPSYNANIDIDWDQILKISEKLTKRAGRLGIGLLNFNKTDIYRWKQSTLGADHVVLQLEHVKDNVTWESLYPEWIDEEEKSEIPICQSLPKPKVPRKLQFDIIAVKLPCHKSNNNWSRDVARLHLQLTATRLAASAKGQKPIYVLLLTDCFPLPNLFTCKELVLHEGNAWLYKPKLTNLRDKLKLPVGSCELAVPLKAHGRGYSGAVYREAYATVLHSADIYVCGAIAAAQSIRMSGSTRDLVILVDETISDYHREGLATAGWKVRTIQRIRNPKAECDAYNEWNYSKLRLWQLTEYNKIVFIDADILILRNIDFLFELPEITAISNNARLFNSGVMVVEPSKCTFQLLMDHMDEIKSCNGGEQGYLNEIFTWWHRIPKHMNFLKHFWEGDEQVEKDAQTRLFGADPPVLYVLHYLGMKPWLCFRDYDCNWNVDIMHEYASDVAHKKWWMVHDRMPESLQKFCLLRSKQKASLEWDRRQAEKANYANGRWKVEIKDERLNTCFEEFCFWESLLWHWGDANWTDTYAPDT